MILEYEADGAGSIPKTGTAIARGQLVRNATSYQLENVEIIYRQTPKVYGSGHFGARIVFRPDKTLWVTLGDRQKKQPAQDLQTTLGKVIRINRDGSIPPDNPNIQGARPEIWSYGHRNPQGAAMLPASNELWLIEHGPQGGDELNKIVAGRNYGWPVVSYGCNYGTPLDRYPECQLGGGAHAPRYTEPVHYWLPRSIAPSGLAFFHAQTIQPWQGSWLIGSLADRSLWRINPEDPSKAYRILPELKQRIRTVKQGPDGWVYLLTDSGSLLKVHQ